MEYKTKAWRRIDMPEKELILAKQMKFSLWRKIADLVDKVTGGFKGANLSIDKEELEWLSGKEL